MKRTFLSVIAIFFPWIAFLVLGQPIPALVALALQLTFVGWIPAIIWARASIKHVYKNIPEPIPPSENQPNTINQNLGEKQTETPAQDASPTTHDNNPPSQQP